MGAIDTNTIEELRESVGGDAAFLVELIDEFLADAPTQLEALREAVTAGDAERAQRSAHTLKGTSRTFGATDLAALCQEAEAAAASGQLDGLLPRVGEIDAEWSRVRPELTALRDAP
jgi:HPt (histidine-containing phosphotransfer) domain-containing protein